MKVGNSASMQRRECDCANVSEGDNVTDQLTLSCRQEESTEFSFFKISKPLTGKQNKHNHAVCNALYVLMQSNL
jgi:hypothetical protein